MKAISVRQPWADLILQNLKTIEIRKLITSYRGPLIIHAATITGNSEFRRANINPELKSSYDQQAFIGIVDLKDIVKLTRTKWGELQDQHLLPGEWNQEDYKYAWFLENPRRIKPIHHIGLPAIFAVEDKLVTQMLEELK